MAGAFIVLIWIFIIAAIVGLILLRRGEKLQFVTRATSHQVTMAAVGEVGAKRRWTTLTQGAGTVTFTYFRRPSYIILFLLLLFIATIPLAILYAIMARRHEALSVYAAPGDNGETYVQIVSNGWRGKGAGRAIQGQLGVVAAPTAAPAVAAPPAAAPIVMAPAARLQAPAPMAAPVPMNTAFTAGTTRGLACKTCGAALKPEARFCAACGATVSSGCSACGEPLPDDARFCMSCGHPVPVPASSPAL
jgi:hypothetical protein